ncbi:MAG: TadE/TadG family type IV pilus assembly protein [Pseudomonadota bacterium]
MLHLLQGRLDTVPGCASARGAVDRPSLVKRFAADDRGNIAIIFALTSAIVIGMVGGAVDYGRALQLRSQMQGAMDAAVLAAARHWQQEGDLTAAKTKGETRFDILAPAASSALSREIVFNTTESTVTGNASAVLNTPFIAAAMNIINRFSFTGDSGKKTIEVDVTASALLAVGGNSELNIELSMMLDVTGSMSGNKMAQLKLAAKDLIDIIVWADQSEFSSRVALAPFSEFVNVGTAYHQAVTGVYESSNSWTCVGERNSSSNLYNDKSPSVGGFFKRNNNVGYSCRPSGSKIMAMTRDKDALKARIDSMGTQGGTAGHLGIAWAWYLLSPNWNSVFPTSSAAAPYPSGHDSEDEEDRTAAYEAVKLRKIAVLMTDGVFNRDYVSGVNSSTMAATLCENMKKKGIVVYSVGFELSSNSVRDLMRNCATAPEYFYDASNGDELRMAFRDIALKIASLRLSK